MGPHVGRCEGSVSVFRGFARTVSSALRSPASGRWVYGLNDSPSAWSKTLNQALLDVGFERSRLDPCLYFLREAGQLTGAFGVHVDDNATGGEGPKYQAALEALKRKFEFRKWRLYNGDFCGANYNKDRDTGEITMSQEAVVSKLGPLRLSRARTLDKDAELTPEEVSVFVQSMEA